jgi:hypothetical protein
VGLGDLAHDRQPEARSLAPAGAVPAVEAIEHERAPRRRHARPVVAHRDLAAAHAHLDDAARRPVLGGVVEQVADRAGEPVGQPLDDARLEVELEAARRGASGRRARR